MLLIKNAEVMTMDQSNTVCNSVLIKDGFIKAVGNNLTDDKAAVYDAEGKWVLPGLIDAHCHIGMWEDGIGIEGADGNEMSDPVTPSLRAIDAINPFDRAFAQAREAGVTTVVTGPGSANVIGGQFAAVKTAGRRIDDMIVRAPLAVKVAFGENPKRVYNEQEKAPRTRMATAQLLRSALSRAQEYKRKTYGNIEREEQLPERDLGMEALVMVLDGKIPLKAHCHRADDIMTALRIAKEFGVDITLDHCTEGHLVADILAKEHAKIILGPLFSTRPKIEMANLDMSAPVILHQAGIEFAITSDHPETPIWYLPVYAGLAARQGLPIEVALRSITINAAKVVGISDSLGSIEKGKCADIAVFDGYPLELASRCVLTLINGQAVHGKL